MPRTPSLPSVVAILSLLCLPTALLATDVDGPNDCQRDILDFGDAPEGVQAYAGVPGSFPTCTAPGPVGTQELACAPISTAPLAAGYVVHIGNPPAGFWLGCASTPFGMMGIDPEGDAKYNDTGAAASACDAGVTVDCVEAAFGLSFGQDECYGSSDAGIASPITFNTCAPSTVTFETANCLTVQQAAYLNILVDWNADGDWNDNFQCPGACAYEWAVKNALISIPPGCATLNSPVFVAGPNAGRGWLRITISEDPAPDDFPWAGSANLAPVRALLRGETEDYPVIIQTLQDPCPPYRDFGDAPEEVSPYPSGISGHFPTCLFASTPGTQDLDCAPISTPPGATGHVIHVRSTGDATGFWLGCGDAAVPDDGVDGEADGKTNDTGGAASACDTSVPVDCVQAAFGMSFGQDECYGDLDAGIAAPITFPTCTTPSITFDAFNCRDDRDVFLNILVDWNEDGDWNDNFLCSAAQGLCAYEWAVKNYSFVLPPGCSSITSPAFLTSPRPGRGWLRITLTEAPVPDDFPWAGSAGGAVGFFRGGETEDYPVIITGRDVCPQGYVEFGDAPEEIAAYPFLGTSHFPTCIFASTPGTQEIECGLPSSTPPGSTGYVRHVSPAAAPHRFWLGCGLPGLPGLGVDPEPNGKTSLAAVIGPSVCDPAVIVDCLEAAFGMSFGQDECYGDADAGVTAPLSFAACSLAAVPFVAYNCEADPETVYLNILVDWNQDADWNDNILCTTINKCAREWAVKNLPIVLVPGCGTYLSPAFQVGPKRGPSWLRISLTHHPVHDDYPWAGSETYPGSTFLGGETEDYPVIIEPSRIGVDSRPREGLWLEVTPNPSPERTTAVFALPREGHVSLAAFDLAGRKLRTLAQGTLPAGEHRIPWDFRDEQGAELPVGVYVIQLNAGGRVLTQRAVRMR